MKVFLSWSGTRSHKVALVFRDWLPSVIQEIVPYVSSEDIDKGARWSTDIAKELADSTFGILCVTRENINAPWLNFEAGALSKTMDKAFVSPFLFDVKRSEVDGPILQFQSTVFEKADLKKLVQTINKACDPHGLSSERLTKAFNVWYPNLEEELKKLGDLPDDAPADANQLPETPGTQEILEEILDLSRINQKLIRNPDGSLGSRLEEMNQLIQSLLERVDSGDSMFSKRRGKRIHPMMLEELLHFCPPGKDRFVGFQMALALIRNDFPWLYDAGIETIGILRAPRRSQADKRTAVEEFERLLEFSFGHPMMREFYEESRDYRFLREFPHYFTRALAEAVDG